MGNLISLNNVSYTYPTLYGAPNPALHCINLAILEREYLVIVGHNGSGKSTLARLLNGLLLPTAGDVLVAGWNTRDTIALPEIRRRVGLIFQVPDNQLVANTVEEDVAFGPENLGLESPEIESRVRSALQDVNMWELRPPHMLSAGQKQRVAIAGVLAMRPQCIVFDEATAMLDPAGKRDVLRLAKQLHARGHTIVMITHDMAEALAADRIVVLNRGQVVFVGAPAQAFSQPDQLRQFGLLMPPIQALAHALHQHHPNFPRFVHDSDELARAVCNLASSLAS